MSGHDVRPEALQISAPFDFMEKPLDLKRLSHALVQVVDTLKH